MTTLLSESIISDSDAFHEDNSSDYSPDEGENYSTSDEDYEGIIIVLITSDPITEEPPSKIIRSHPSNGSRLRIGIKFDNPIRYPIMPKERSDDGSELAPGECGWENCLVCERDAPLMLQTQNPTWYAQNI